MLIIKIAWRNIWRHKGKTLVVGLILFLGSFLMTVGNSVIEGGKKGMKENVVDRFSGQLVVTSEKQKRKDLFFAGHEIKLITDYPPIRDVLKSQSYIQDYLAVTRGQVMILNPNGISATAFFLGVKFDDYQNFFSNNVKVIEGKSLSDSMAGLLISDETRKKIFDKQKYWIVPEGEELQVSNLTPKALKLYNEHRLTVRSDLLIMGKGQESLETDARVPVKGIFQFEQLNKMWASYINFMDIGSYRMCFGHLTGGDQLSDLSEEQKAFLSMNTSDEVFADTSYTMASMPLKTSDVKSDASIGSNQSTSNGIDSENGVFSMVMIKLKPGIELENAKKQLTELFSSQHIKAKVLNWRESLGEIADISIIVQSGLFLFVMFIFLVAVIIIINTLSMAALERSSEIGMMRAVGSQKKFVVTMFLAETLQIAIVFGGIGILAGILTTYILSWCNFSVAQNEYLSILVGGNIFHPIVSFPGILLGIAQLLISTILATLYPMYISANISPLEAIARD